VKQHYRIFGLAAGLTTTVLFVWYVVRSLRGHDLSVYVTPHAALGILVATALWACGAPLLALAWRDLLKGVGVLRSRRELFAIVGITQFAKYIPGNVAQYIGRVGMSLARAIPARPLAVTLTLEPLLLVAAAVVVGVGTGTLSEYGLQAVRRHTAQLALLTLVVGLAIGGLFVFRRLAPMRLRRFAPKYAPVLDGTKLPPQKSLVRAFLLYCCMYAGMGISLNLLAHFLLPDAPRDYWLLVAAFALAWVVGFVTPGSPGGLGVREGLMLLMLAPVFSAASGSLLVIALRIATTLGDVVILGAGLLLLPKRPESAPDTTEPP